MADIGFPQVPFLISSYILCIPLCRPFILLYTLDFLLVNYPSRKLFKYFVRGIIFICVKLK